MVLHLLASIDARKFPVVESNLHHLQVWTQTFGNRKEEFLFSLIQQGFHDLDLTW
jgi:hypothetical protein